MSVVPLRKRAPAQRTAAAAPLASQRICTRQIPIAARDSIAVDTDVPISRRVLPRHAGQRYPTDTMKVGDSFAIRTNQDHRLEANIRAAAREYGRDHRKRFLSGRDEVDPNLFRVWRIA